MNKQLFSLFLTAALMVSCASSNANASGLRDAGGNASDPSSSGTNAANPSSLEGYEWKLIAVFINGNNTQFNRNSLPAELGNSFTLNFSTDLISGVGAPNRYSAPYTLGDNQAISIMVMRSTLMASFLEPENLKEHDFYTYMQNSYSWKLVNNNLELQSKTANGSEVRLVFSL